MPKILLILIAFLSVLASCSTYQKTSVSLSEAVNKGTVKTINESGKEILLESIKELDGNYYGIQSHFIIHVSNQKSIL